MTRFLNGLIISLRDACRIGQRGFLRVGGGSALFFCNFFSIMHPRPGVCLCVCSRISKSSRTDLVYVFMYVRMYHPSRVHGGRSWSGPDPKGGGGGRASTDPKIVTWNNVLCRRRRRRRFCFRGSVSAPGACQASFLTRAPPVAFSGVQLFGRLAVLEIHTLRY